MSFRVLVKVDDATNLATWLFYVGNAALSSSYQWFIAQTDPSLTKAQHYVKAGEWVWITFGFQDAGIVGTPDRSALTHIRLAASAANGSSITVHFGGIALVDESTAFPSGVVSFCYDDSLESTYTQARVALDKYGWVGTEYVICDLVGSGGKYISLADLQTLEDAGWTVGAHSYTLADHATGFTNLNTQQLTDNLRNMRRQLTAWGLQGGDHLAYPGGGYNAAVLAVTDQFHTSARTVNHQTLETLRPSDALRIRSASLVNTTTVAYIKNLIDNALASKGWLVLTFHDLVTTATSSDQYAIADHQTIVDYCATVGIRVSSVADVMSRMNAPVPVSGYTTAQLVNQTLGNTSTRIGCYPYRISSPVATAVTAGDLNLVCFTPVVDITITAMSAMSGSTAFAGSTLTRIGLFTTDPSTGAITLVAATDSDTTLFTAPSTVYRKVLGTTGGLPTAYTLKAGQRYAVGVLGVGLSAGSLFMGAISSVLTARLPRMCGKIASQTDLPPTATIVATPTPIWAEVG
ncbi:MAG: polysaccharide deacetylase family protein [Candidatus Saccharimonadales bacterium]